MSAARGATPAVAVVILNWNGWKDTLPCLDSLQAERHADFDVFIIDNGSTDDSIARLEEWCRRSGWGHAVVPLEGAAADPGPVPRVTILRSATNLGFTGGNNAAIRHALATGRPYGHVWLLNADTTVRPGALAELVDALEAEPRAGSAQSLLVKMHDPALVDSAGLRLLRRGGAKDIHALQPVRALLETLGARAVVPMFGCCAASVLYRVAALGQVGLFDESFFATNEDVDLACRLQAAGWGAVLATRSVVLHRGGVSRRRKLGRWWFMANRNKLVVAARWWPRRYLVPVLGVGVARAVLTVVRSPDVGWTDLAGLLRQLVAEGTAGGTASERNRVLACGARGIS